MELFKQIDLQDCPVCHGSGILEEENGWCYYIECMDCGCHTAEVAFEKNSQRLEAARKAAHLWNIGKVLSHDPGE